MYNRYIPQPDGSFRRSYQPDRAPARRQPTPQKQPRQEASSAPPAEIDCPPSPPPKEEREIPRQEPYRTQPPQGQSITSFLRQLLPKDFDTADMIIVLLLLLMAGDNPEEQNNALLTLALYLFM